VAAEIDCDADGIRKCSHPRCGLNNATANLFVRHGHGPGQSYETIMILYPLGCVCVKASSTDCSAQSQLITHSNPVPQYDRDG
jgi:hypothetical protein